MSDDADNERSELIRHIIFRIGAPLLDMPRPEEPPILGQDYAWRLDALFDRLEDIHGAILKALASLSDEALYEFVNDDAQPQSDAAHHLFSLFQGKLRAEQEGMDEWLWAPFMEETSLADFAHWAKVPHYSLEEIVWLSVGLAPLRRRFRLLMHAPAFSEEEDPVLDLLAKRRDLLRRALDPDDTGAKITGSALLDLIEKINLEVHPGFRRMIDAHMAIHAPGAAAPKAASRKQGGIEARERNSLAILIYAFAKEKYGYDPEESRNRVPTKIADLVTRAGLKIDPKTIRKYLLLGAERASGYGDI